MSGGTAPTPERWWLRPRVVLPVGLLVLVLVILLSPAGDDSGAPQLTTYSTSAMGARGIYDVLGRLGWRTSRWRQTLDTTLNRDAVYAILDPSVDLDSAELDTLHRFVRDGGRLLIVSSDSEFVSFTQMRPVLYSGIDTARGTAPGRVPVNKMLAAGDSANVAHVGTANEPQGMFDALQLTPSWMVEPLPPVHDSIAVFLWAPGKRQDSTFGTAAVLRDSASGAALVLGRRVGAGHVVLIAAPLLVTNLAIREGHSALALQRAMEWLAPPHRAIVFDEYHHGFARHDADVLAAVQSALADTPAGHGGIQLIVAAGLLLIALGVRAIAPRSVQQIQRRSLLEHVDALGRAYQQIHAGTFGTRQLLRGVRRRHPTGAAAGRGGAVSDAEYLTAMQRRYAIAQEEIDCVTRALGDKAVRSDGRFLEAGRALAKIEQAMQTQ
jgi:hypothetical protein